MIYMIYPTVLNSKSIIQKLIITKVILLVVKKIYFALFVRLIASNWKAIRQRRFYFA